MTIDPLCRADALSCLGIDMMEYRYRLRLLGASMFSSISSSLLNFTGGGFSGRGGGKAMFSMDPE